MINLPSKTLRILIIDDDRIHLHLLKRYLSSKNHTILTANSAVEAIPLLKDVDVVISDYNMQPMNGLDLCKSIRQNKEFSWLYIILVTADNDLSLLSEAFEIGVNDFILKPVNPIELNARLLSAKHTVEIIDYCTKELKNIKQHTFNLETMVEDLRNLVELDALTNLSNRSYANRRLDELWATYKRRNEDFALISIDVDKFKFINDTYGHPVGDQVLMCLAEILQSNVRAYDISCRMGGDEFLIICPNCPIENLILLAERIKDSIKNCCVEYPFDISMGAAISDSSKDANWHDTIKRSDDALYISKKNKDSTITIL